MFWSPLHCIDFLYNRCDGIIVATVFSDAETSFRRQSDIGFWWEKKWIWWPRLYRTLEIQGLPSHLLHSLFVITRKPTATEIFTYSHLLSRRCQVDSAKGQVSNFNVHLLSFGVEKRMSLLLLQIQCQIEASRGSLEWQFEGWIVLLTCNWYYGSERLILVQF